MSEAKIPERWQEEYGLAKNEYCDALTVQLIEELGAAEQERDHFQSLWAETVRKQYECMAEVARIGQERDEKVETISELSRLAAEAGREITRLKDEHANQLMAIAQNEALRIAQYRRYALREAANYLIGYGCLMHIDPDQTRNDFVLAFVEKQVQALYELADKD